MCAPPRILPRSQNQGAWLGLLLVLLTFGCGGGSQSSAPPPPPPPNPDFTLAVSPATVTVYPGNGTPVSVSAAAINGFTSQISVQLSGLPSGVSASPASFTLTPGTPQNVTLSASSNAPVSTTTATFSGTSGSLSHSAKVSVSVGQQTTNALPTRTRYLRSDAVTEYAYSVNTHWEVFHKPTSRFFVTDPFSNQVFVFDSTTETEIGKIAVPGAYGIDETPDQSTLYVGTMIGDVYTIDPVAMKVTHRYLASEIGPYGYQGLIALPLANGSIALLGAAGGIPSVDGSSSFAVWNPNGNSITIYGSSYGVGQLSGVPATTVCGSLENIGGFTLTADRTTVILGSIDSDSTLCEVNATTGQDSYIATASGFLIKIITSPDGKYIALPVYPGQIALYDAHTLNKVTQFAVAGDTSSASTFVFSADSQTLFVPGGGLVYAYSTTGQQLGWLPDMYLPPTAGGGEVGSANTPNYEAEDGTGLLAGPMEEGIGFLDTTAMHTGPVGTAFTNAYLNPAAGPTSGGTQVQWSMQLTGSTSPTVYFGGSQASSVSAGGGNLTVTTPPNGPGPVPVYVFAPDGGMQLVPDGFSYGPSILEVSANASTADGGGTGVIYGYGFLPNGATTLPSNLSVSVGGSPAKIVGFNPQSYNLLSPPFLLQSIYYTIPPGTAGTSADVTLTSNSGVTTARNALAYLPTPQQFPLAGSQLAQGIYDPTRDVYYFTDTNRIQVFSLTQGSWLAPISIPAPLGTTQRLWGIALSPDGSKLAVADAQANVIYLLDPSSPSAVQTFGFAPSYNSGFISHPIGVSISDAGNIYITAWVEGGSGSHNFFKLDTSTGALTDYGIDGSDTYNPVTNTYLDAYLKTAISSDNSRVFFNDDGYVFNIDTATDKIFNASAYQSCCYGNDELTLSSNQTQFAASSYLYDSNLNAQSSLTLNDREVLDTSYIYGAKLSPDGSLLFQPTTNGLDVYDGRLGPLLTRIALPFPLSTNYDALVSDGKDNVLIAITGTNGDGIAVLDLTSLGEPAPLPYAGALSARALTDSHRRAALGSNGSHAKGKLAFPGVHVIPHVTHFILAPTRRIPR